VHLFSEPQNLVFCGEKTYNTHVGSAVGPDQVTVIVSLKTKVTFRFSPGWLASGIQHLPKVPHR